MSLVARPPWALAFAAGCAAGSGAGSAASVPPSFVLPVAPTAPDSAVRAAGSGAPARGLFPPLRDRVLLGLFADDPTNARDLGLHDYDGKIAPISREALDARVARLNRDAADLENIDPTALTEDEALDLAELKGQVTASLFWLVEMDGARKYPQTYEPLFTVNTYVDRQYAPIEERAKRLLAHEEAALGEMGHLRENLTPPLSKPVAEVTQRNFAGFAVYLRRDVAKVMGGIGDDAQRARFARANEALATAADDLGSWLKREAARGDQSHVLGPSRYAKLLLVQEGLTLPLADFERMNEDDLARNKSAYEALAVRVKEKPVGEAEYFAKAAHMTQDARKFVIDHRIVSLASRDEVTVRETPPYKRWNAASIEMSGPFEASKSAFYYLTIPDRSWSKKQREGYFGTVGDLLGTTIHEVYPGHFVQGRWQDRAPTKVQMAFDNYAFVEGWAHYTEQMMIEQGFGMEDLGNELAMLRGALLRNCRFAASVGIHTRGLTVEQATRRFIEDCHQDEATAREQAVRGTFDPGYFAYTLGKLQIVALRDEAKAQLGNRFSLQRFHDALLSHGAPPIALVHDRVLREVGVAR